MAVLFCVVFVFAGVLTLSFAHVPTSPEASKAPDGGVSEDQRVQVQPPETREYQAVVRLSFGYRNGKVSHCSGTLVEGVVITADHCVYGQGRVDIVSMHAIPAASPGDSPFGITTIRSFSVIEDQDIAVLYPEKQLIPLEAQMKLGVFDPQLTYAATGYPGDKPRETMWTSSYEGFVRYGDDRLKYDGGFEYDATNVWLSRGISAGGQSGSGISTDQVIRGVLSGVTSCDNPCDNQQTILFGFTPELVKEIRDRINHQTEYERRFN